MSKEQEQRFKDRLKKAEVKLSAMRREECFPRTVVEEVGKHHIVIKRVLLCPNGSEWKGSK